MLQVAALCASIREPSVNRHLPDSHDEQGEENRESVESTKADHDEFDQFLENHKECSNQEDAQPSIKAGDLVKTAKVHFVQSFKSKKTDQRLHISGHR